VGLVHKDFCRENMVVSPDGVVRVVDNETLAVDCPDYDLTRTWYRWPMDPAQAVAYLAGYRRHRSTETLARHFPFWAVAVLSESALFRLRRGLSAALPLGRLRELLDRHAVSGERPAFVERRGQGSSADASP
jgi:aminoglycoside phosphotransferase (APT) family kinase protein